MRAARASADACDVFGARIANSSPPHRAARSVSRSCEANHIRQPHESGVTRVVAVSVVDLLEAVEIHEQQRDRVMIAPTARQLGVDAREQPTAVGEARQRIRF
jgi:hypothetical protein